MDFLQLSQQTDIKNSDIDKLFRIRPGERRRIHRIPKDSSNPSNKQGRPDTPIEPGSDDRRLSLFYDTDDEIMSKRDDVRGEDVTSDPATAELRKMYIQTCKVLGVVPTSGFLKHLSDVKLKLSYQQLKPVNLLAILSCLKTSTVLTHLDLSNNSLNEKAAYVIHDLLKENCYITTMILANNQFGVAGTDLICESVAESTSIQHLDLSHCELDERMASAISKMIEDVIRLKSLDLSNNKFDRNSGYLLANGIKENGSLLALDLSWNNFRKGGGAALCKALEENSTLQTVNLSWNGLGLEGATALSNVFKKNTVLTSLDISNNRFTTESAVILSKGLSKNQTLQVLKVGQNPMMSAGCWALCSALIKNPEPAVEVLDFADIRVDDDFHQLFEELRLKIRNIKVTHNATEPPLKPKARLHPMIKLQNYITKHELKLIDFFQKFDKDGSMSVSYDEFSEGIQELGIRLQDDEIKLLLEELDKDGDGEINYSELVIGNQEFSEKEKQNRPFL